VSTDAKLEDDVKVTDRPLTPKQFIQLVELTGMLEEEAAGCAKDGRWRAAVLLVAASVEAALLATVVGWESDLRKQRKWPPDSSLPYRWSLNRLLKVARDADWLPYQLPDQRNETTPVDALGGDVGDAVYFLKKVRNLAAHPGAAVADQQLSGLDFTDDLVMPRIYQSLKGIAGAVRDKLYEVIQ
jgi:hypothetical protein